MSFGSVRALMSGEIAAWQQRPIAGHRSDLAGWREEARMDEKVGHAGSEAAIREIIEAWAAAVRRRDYPAILQNHSPDIVMFDVPPPLRSEGLEAYKKTWELFFSWTDRPIPFDFIDLTITADGHVAFAFATLNCAEPGPD